MNAFWRAEGAEEQSESEDESADEYELETIVAIQRSLASESRQSRAKRRLGPSREAVAGTDEEEEFADMSEKELRFHKYAELKANWEDANGRIVPASLSYLLIEQSNVWAGSHLAKRQDQREKKLRVNSF